MGRAEDENDILREAVSRTFSNSERVEGKVEAERVTISNLLEKMNTMEKRNEERLIKLMKEHKADLKRARNDDDGGGSSEGYQGSSNGGGKRDYKKARTQGRHLKERKANNRAKWEELLAMKLDRPGSG